MYKTFLLAVTALGLMVTAFLFATSTHDTALALHAMPCPDLDADGVVTPFDVAISGSYPAGMPIPPAPAPLDMDGDTFATPIDTGFIAGAVGAVGLICQDTPVGPGPAAGPAADWDADGCTNVEEIGLVPALGGGRDIYNHWDFYDVTGDLAVAGGDFFALLSRFGSGDGTPGKVDPPMSPVPPPPAYHSSFDRGPPVIPLFPVDLGPPSGAIAGTDFFAILTQFGHSCAAPP